MEKQADLRTIVHAHVRHHASMHKRTSATKGLLGRPTMWCCSQCHQGPGHMTPLLVSLQILCNR